MKVLLLNGSPHAAGANHTALQEMVKVFEENGVETEVIQVGNLAVRGCIACGSCYKTGTCVFDDMVNEAAKKLFISQPSLSAAIKEIEEESK